MFKNFFSHFFALFHANFSGGVEEGDGVAAVGHDKDAQIGLISAVKTFSPGIISPPAPGRMGTVEGVVPIISMQLFIEYLIDIPGLLIG